MFVCFTKKTKHKKCNKLIKVESDKFCGKTGKICNENEDHGLRVKIGGDFSKLLLLKAHNHKKCYTAYVKPAKLKSDDYMTRHLKTLQRISRKL